MGEMVKQYQAKFEDMVNKPGCVGDGLSFLETKTKVKKVYIAYGILGVLALWLMFGYGAQLVCNVIGFLYPAYCSIKALESKNKEDDTQWLMYWVVFALFSVVEFFSDILVGWVPFYWLSKCLFLVWCMSPMDGSTIIYKKIILPFFLKHEPALDNIVNKGKEKMSKFAGDALEKAKDIAAEQHLKKDD